MKKVFVFLLIIWGFNSCISFPRPGDNQEESIGNITRLQDDGFETFETYINILEDTTLALEEALEVILENPDVEWAQINSQGIAIQYENGIRGGIMITGEDDPESFPDVPEPPPPPVNKSVNTCSYEKSVQLYENIPANKKTIFINPHNFERANHANNILNIANYWFPKCGFTAPEQFLNNNATVDVFTTLDDYGIVHLYTHGWAWPKKTNITEVYCLTGETVNETTSKKYWDDITEGHIPIVRATEGNKYFLGPEFITKYNDFEEGKTFFYGGFCYSFLGNWPEEMNDEADALAYTGFSWSVLTSYNSSWAQFLYHKMMQTGEPQPMNLEEWLTNTDGDIAKRHRDARTKNDPEWVYFHYAGAGDMVFWQPLKIDPQEMEGVPDQSYTWKIEYPELPAQYYVVWDFGDGNPKVKVDDSPTVSYTYTKSDTFKIKATLYKKPENQAIGQTEAQAIINDEETIDGESFGFSWTIPYGYTWPRYTITSSISGTVKGLEGNEVESINGYEFGIGRIDITFTEDGPFRIEFNCSFSVTPATQDTTYESGARDVLTFDSGQNSITWLTQGIDPYVWQESSSGVFEHDQVTGSISIMRHMWATWEYYDDEQKLIETEEGWDSSPLFLISFWN
ncbi:MAG: hypothetical protein K9H26_03835 [Prolixibacteraceae bacterium]|nr:hypothetical protein [Prolixibacteraceae bacterium]